MDTKIAENLINKMLNEGDFDNSATKEQMILLKGLMDTWMGTVKSMRSEFLGMINDASKSRIEYPPDRFPNPNALISLILKDLDRIGDHVLILYKAL